MKRIPLLVVLLAALWLPVLGPTVVSLPASDALAQPQGTQDTQARHLPDGKVQAVKEVVRTEDNRVQAVLHADTATLGRLLADELVYTHSTGRVDTKTSFIQNIQSKELIYEKMEHADVNVRVYGGVALLTGRSAVRVRSARMPGQAQSFEIRFLNVYAKKNRAWQQGPGSPRASPNNEQTRELEQK